MFVAAEDVRLERTTEHLEQMERGSMMRLDMIRMEETFVVEDLELFVLY